MEKSLKIVVGILAGLGVTAGGLALVQKTVKHGKFDSDGANKSSINQDEYDSEGYNYLGFNRQGYNRQGFDVDGYDSGGYDECGYDRKGFDNEGFDSSGYDNRGFDREGYDAQGFNCLGRNAEGYDRRGYNQEGYNLEGFDRANFSSRYYAARIAELRERQHRAYVRVQNGEFGYALYDSRVVLEETLKLLIQHFDGVSVLGDTIAQNLKICEREAILDRPFLDRLHDARKICNSCQHELRAEKCIHKKQACFTVLQMRDLINTAEKILVR